MLKESDMSIDLGGIAKGFAADQVLNILSNVNIKDGLINLGSSSIYAVGKNEINHLGPLELSTLGMKIREII